MSRRGGTNNENVLRWLSCTVTDLSFLPADEWESTQPQPQPPHALDLPWRPHDVYCRLRTVEADRIPPEIIGLGTHDDHDCPICVEPLLEVPKCSMYDSGGHYLCGRLIKHEICERTFHQRCLETWIAALQSNGRCPKCPICREHLNVKEEIRLAMVQTIRTYMNYREAGDQPRGRASARDQRQASIMDPDSRWGIINQAQGSLQGHIGPAAIRSFPDYAVGPVYEYVITEETSQSEEDDEDNVDFNDEQEMIFATIRRGDLCTGQELGM